MEKVEHVQSNNDTRTTSLMLLRDLYCWYEHILHLFIVFLFLLELQLPVVRNYLLLATQELYQGLFESLIACGTRTQCPF